MTVRPLLRGAAILSALLGIIATSPAGAAMIKVSIDGGALEDPTAIKEPVAPGESSTISIFLSLDPAADEAASGFEAAFGLNAIGSADWNVTAFEPISGCGSLPWASCAGSQDSDSANVSLLSSNEGGDRLVAAFEVTRDPGSMGGARFEVTLERKLAFRDIDEAPFVQDVPVSTANGTVLATLVPEPGTPLLAGIGLVGLFVMRRWRA